ncbi:MAG TPA: threonine synthase [Pyrinomonadaceae bacterium]|nr:threonine synthase [Pyrinomonadaceae bacterium]
MTADASTASFVQRCIESDCGHTYGIEEPIYTCSLCGGLLDIECSDSSALEPQILRSVWLDRKISTDARDRSGVWRFREVLPFDTKVDVISLDEGNTPLYEAPRSAAYCKVDALQLKHQGNNPTGSFKDTGMTVAVTQARALGARVVACASTGNTAASLAAYAARAGLPCAILVPTGQVSHAKLAQALDYGARVLEIEGNFDSCMRLIRELSEDGSLYLVNSINPFRIEGQKTVAFELVEQLGWKVPDHLIVPGGNLGNSSAFGKGFRELLALKLIDRMPRITVVQAEGAAPFARFFVAKQSADSAVSLTDEPHPQTLASAIKIGAPVSWKKAWRAVEETGGVVLTVTEQEIADAKAVIGADGIGCEPASATTVAGIRKLRSEELIEADEQVVAVLTGHILKDTDYVIDYHNNTLRSEGEVPITGRFRNTPLQVSAGREELRSVLTAMQLETQ